VTDTNPAVSFTGQLTDVSQVDKFELTEEEYAKRQGKWYIKTRRRITKLFQKSLLSLDTVLVYKQRHKVGRFADKNAEEADSSTVNADISIGSRCEVESTEEGLSKRGIVRFVGTTKFSKGVWVGVEYDEPFGKNDGS